MSHNRCLRSLARQRRNNKRRRDGKSVGKSVHSGSLCSVLPMASTAVSAGNGDPPANISKRMHPNEKISVRLSVSRPRVCSGEAYPTVPIIMPGVVDPVLPLKPATCVTVSILDGESDNGASDDCSVIALARPKSSTFALPSPSSFTLAGLRSR